MVITTQLWVMNACTVQLIMSVIRGCKYSSFNSMNMFEIAHSIERQFGKEPWCLYTGKHLLTFVDNHDVSRIASTLTNKAHLPLIYALMFGMPGIPCIYYGSEWGQTGKKEQESEIL